MVIFQKPNKPLIAFFVSYVLSRFLTGDLRDIATIFSIVALGYWAYLEITDGVNAFRRFLGWVVMLATINHAVHIVFY